MVLDAGIGYFILYQQLPSSEKLFVYFSKFKAWISCGTTESNSSSSLSQAVVMWLFSSALQFVAAPIPALASFLCLTLISSH